MNLEKGFTKESFNDIRTYLNNKFEEIKKETGIDFSIGNITFEPDTFRTQLTAKINNGTKEEEAKKEWDKYCEMFGLKKEWFGKTFTSSSNGKTYTICGIKKWASERPVIAKDNENKEYLFKHLAIIPKFLTKTDTLKF